MATFRVHRVRFFEFQPRAIHCVTYNSSSERLAVSREDGSIEIWSVKDNWYQEKVISAGESESTEAITWCSDRLFSASLDARVIEYNLTELRKERWEASNAGAVWSLAGNSSNTLLAAGTEDGCVVLYDITNGGFSYERAFDKQEGRILTLAWHRSGDVIVTGGVDNMRVWSVKAGHAVQRITVPRQHRNKETIVWSVLLLDDMTLVSGDSQGKTSFWNGKQGTLIKSYKSHKADVLVVCANEAGDTIASGGIDPQVIQFRLSGTQQGVARQWVPSRSHGYHTHDVRAMAFVGKCLTSGGVDTTLIACHVGQNLSQQYLKLPPVPHTPLLRIAKTARVLLLNYSLYLEMWQLGNTNQSSEKNGEILPLNSQPIKLLRLNARSEACVVCSAISHDAQLIAYSDQSSIKVYRVDIDRTSDTPKVSLTKLKLMDALRPAHKLELTADGDRLMALSDNGDLLLLDVMGDMVELLDTAHQPSVTDTVASPHLLAISPDGSYVATADHRHNVHIYIVDESKLQWHGCLPRHSSQPTALSFSPSSTRIAVAYSDRRVLEYRVKKLHFTDWCKNILSSYHPDWLATAGTLSHVAYCHDDPDLIIVHDAEMFCLLNKKQPFPGANVKGSLHDHTGANAFHICDKYKYLLMAESLDDDWLVIVERPPISISQSLPPPLELKKYGT